jgi:hypothetical protein
MTSEHKYGLVGHDFARKDSIARVTGREIYSVDGYSFGVATSNARTLSFLCLRWCNVDMRQLETVGHDFGRMCARARHSLPAASENAAGVLVAQPRSCE